MPLVVQPHPFVVMHRDGDPFAVKHPMHVSHTLHAQGFFYFQKISLISEEIWLNQLFSILILFP